ncbi:MAG TPA: MFS transporter, partial [Dehalococcoidia bacterium]|nr:MFS transporter [Dehalococcoidia bacterium]
MSGTPGRANGAKHDPFEALRQPAFVIYTFSRVFSSVGNAALQAILLWHVYELTDSELSLGVLGLVRFVPALGVSLIGGNVADAYNRRTVINIAQTVPLTCGIVLAVSTLNGWVTVDLIYGLVLVIGLASSFENPARQALLPAIVRPETFANAVTVSSTLQSLGMVTGGLIGGILAGVYIGGAYVLYTVIIAGAFVSMAMLPYHHVAGENQRGLSVAAIKEGVHYVWTHQVI